MVLQQKELITHLLTSRKQEGWSCHARREPAISFAERFPPAEAHYSTEEMPGIIHFLEQVYLYSHCGHHPAHVAPGTGLRWARFGAERVLTPNHEKVNFPRRWVMQEKGRNTSHCHGPWDGPRPCMDTPTAPLGAL